MMDATEERLRERGLRVTAPRVAVLQVLADHSHVPADMVASAARGRVGAVSTQGIYNVLTDLVAAGLVHRIEPAGSPALYELSSPTLITTSSAVTADASPTSSASTTSSPA